MSEIKRNGHGAMDMTQGSPTRLIVLFSLPLLAGNVLQQLYNMVDSVVVGNYVGSSALTAVGGAGALRLRLLDMGLIPKTTVRVEKVAPLGDPIELRLRGYELTLRLDDAREIALEAPDGEAK